jgi:phenylacetate-CoA ligase
MLRMRILDIVRRSNQGDSYKYLCKNQYLATESDVRDYWVKKFKNIFQYHYRNNEEYRRYINDQGYDSSVSEVDVPIIDKNYFRGVVNSSIIKNSVSRKHSGGSTGVPLTYYLSRQSMSYFWPSIWRAFDVYKIKPFDNVMMIAGPSLYNNRSMIRQIYDKVNNFTIISAFDLSDAAIQKALDLISKKKIKAIFGYTSSILSFVEYLSLNNIFINLSTIFTTSESFIPSIRPLVKKHCNCDVIDIYGANDGGITAFECQMHQGYHVNYERTMVEIIDKKIILTDLLNTASPFIRYEVGDITSAKDIDFTRCECDRILPRIPNISGRINDYIKDENGNRIHTEFFTHLFSSDSSILQFQLIDDKDTLFINIVSDGDKNNLYDKYEFMIKKKLDRKFSIIFNQNLQAYENGKIPILYKRI